MTDPTEPQAGASPSDRQAAHFERALSKLERTSPFAKITTRGPVLDLAGRILAEPGGAAAVHRNAARLARAGVFTGTDWEHPERLKPKLAAGTLVHGDRAAAALEMLSELRILALAEGDDFHPGMSSERARQFLAQVLALNLDRLFGPGGEAERHAGMQARATSNLFAFLAERIGYGHILDHLVCEIDRILAQRPIRIDAVKSMITRIAAAIGSGAEEEPEGARRLVAGLFGPAPACREDPGLGVYEERLASLDEDALAAEAHAFARSMHDTGIVSPYHPVFLRRVNRDRPDLAALALGLSSTGREALSCYADLVGTLVEAAVTSETEQAVLGLALLLERGALFDPAVGPALWGQLQLPLSPRVADAIASSYGTAAPPRTILLAGVLSVLGQPLGVGQGDHPTCQAARAISMWALAAPSYLLHLVTRAARDDEVVLYFEGRRLPSRGLEKGLVEGPVDEVDPVSLVLVPHLDRIYSEMGRLCADRGGDPHAWVNREMHGWWVGRETALAVDVATGKLVDFPGFARRFYSLYHPLHNGNRPVIHPQPAGIAATDGLGRFLGWHAITILRVGIGPKGAVRVYFFNPNNDSGQDWGDGVVVSTEGHGERFGESSLPIAEFTSRLYLFHYDTFDEGDASHVSTEELAAIEAGARATWARDR